MIVDDDVTVAEILSRYLVREGYEVESVGDGRKAVEWTRSHGPDLILLDLMLPGMSGLDVCRRLREFTSVPLIHADGPRRGARARSSGSSSAPTTTS